MKPALLAWMPCLDSLSWSVFEGSPVLFNQGYLLSVSQSMIVDRIHCIIKVLLSIIYAQATYRIRISVSYGLGIHILNKLSISASGCLTRAAKKKKKVLKWPACCAILYKGSCSQTLLQVGITRVVFKMLMPGSHSQILGSNRNREHRWFSKLPGPFYSAVKFRSHCTRAHPLTPPTLPAVYLRSIY